MRYALALAALLLAARVQAQEPVRVNQVGFAPGAPKVAIVADSAATRFAVVDLARGDTVLRGMLGPARAWDASGEVVRAARFDALRAPGRYAVVVPGVGSSPPFAVDTAPLAALARTALKAFYYQRASVPLDARWAGPYARPAGHRDDSVVVHPSAAGPGRPAGAVIAAPGGWYDAGDYNLYVVNSGIATWTLLAFVERYPEAAAALDVDIPERGGALPDVLDEALVNLRWMLRMQGPADGGVYHKLTNAEFDRMDAMPHEARTTRYVVQKSTAAALDLAAVAAQGARLARLHARVLPGLADSLVAAARRAWAWAEAHPDSLYDQQRLNAAYDPDIHTGEYGDRELADERRWAAAELWLTTGERPYLDAVLRAPAPDSLAIPSWGSVGTLATLDLVRQGRPLPRGVDGARFTRELLALAAPLAARAERSAYAVPLGGPSDWAWGSNAVAANEGLVLLEAWRLTREPRWLDAARAALDYLLGRNATGHSFVTGFGAHAPIAPHHRPSVADTVVMPMPGLLVGGPNPGQQDHCAGYPSRLPARSWLDATCSYASNEVAINWNAPLFFLAAALDAEDRGAAATYRATPSAR